MTTATRSSPTCVSSTTSTGVITLDVEVMTLHGSRERIDRGRVVVTDRTGTLMATVTDEKSNLFLTGFVLLMPRNAAEIDPLG